MLRVEDMMEIKILHQQGLSLRRIAKQLGLSRNTVKRYLQLSSPAPYYHPRPALPGKLSPYRAYLKERQQLAEPHWIPATVLYREIREKGYTGSLSLLRQFLHSLKVPVKVEPIIRFETPPGKQMQIDWAEFSRGSHRLSAFIATLGYSRISYVEFVNNEKIDTFLSCLQNAFDYFQGVTQELLFDNMKTVVLLRNAYGQGLHRFHPALWDFAKHYGFIPKLCQPYRAQTKGKVERFIGYLRQSFYVPLRAQLAKVGMHVDVQTANHAVKVWLHTVANCRMHAALQHRPIDLYEEEKPYLIPCTSVYAGIKIQAHSSANLPSVQPLPMMTTIPPQHDLMIYQQILQQQQGAYCEFTA